MEEEEEEDDDDDDEFGCVVGPRAAGGRVHRFGGAAGSVGAGSVGAGGGGCGGADCWLNAPACGGTDVDIGGRPATPAGCGRQGTLAGGG